MTTTATINLAPEPGARVVADHQPGRGPAWVYLHGLTSVRVGEKSCAMFAFAHRRGQAAWRFDFRGHGDSSGTLFDTTLTQLVADTRIVLEHSGPAVLVGSSLGGLVAAWTAVRHPQLVRGLVLLAPALRFLPRLRARLGPDGRPSLQHAQGDLQFSPAVLRDFERHDEDVLARSIHQPTLVVHGRLDETVPVDASAAFVDHLAARRRDFWIVPDGDHRLTASVHAILDRAAAFHDDGGRDERASGDCAT